MQTNRQQLCTTVNVAPHIIHGKEEQSYVVRWPSGLRLQAKDLVRKGVGSNPTLIIFTEPFSFASPTEPGVL